MEICCRENDYAVGKKAINPAGLGTNPTNMIEKCLCNHATVSNFQNLLFWSFEFRSLDIVSDFDI